MSITPPREECDDGDNVSGDGCTSDCRIEFCGDSVVNNNGTEQCDDGNTTNCDGCRDCFLETGCGDGFVCGSEQCDDGNTSNDCNCLNNCTNPYCGDGLICGIETCESDGDCAAGQRCSGCQCTTIDYQASFCFSGTQGECGWEYIYVADPFWELLPDYVVDHWEHNGNAYRIRKDAIQPAAKHVVRMWKTTYEGTARISGTMVDIDGNCSNSTAVEIKIAKDYPHQTLMNWTKVTCTEQTFDFQVELTNEYPSTPSMIYFETRKFGASKGKIQLDPLIQTGL